MLHGRTGCGKSSFLRAALKPLLESTDTGLWFAGASQTFIVVRSGLTPLRQLAGAVFDVAHELKEAPDTSVRDLSAVLRNYQSKEQRADYVDYCSDRVERMIDALTALGEAAPGTPILVIDQAEEVFTLRDTGDRSVSRGAKPPAVPAHDGEHAVTARIDYMNLLRTVAAEPLGVKVLISLRTEYKGLFEDELRRHMSPAASTQLTGFHLNELDAKGLVEAIVHPTTVGATKKGHAGKYRFRYAANVADKIAERLLDTEAVPMGGVLPTLQVVCSRLYEQTLQSKNPRGINEWEIQMTDLERLGNLDDQVAVYLREQLEEMFRKRSSPDSEETDRTKDIDQWYRLLERLVRLQGDGRAVTRQLAADELRKIGEELKCRLFDDDSLNHLLKVGILRNEQQDGTTFWTLGHDSLGLAIHKWAVTYKEFVIPTMRMDINSPRNAARLSREDLCPGDDLIDSSEAPATFRIGVPDELLWDHQIALFAHTRRLSGRLGILFESVPGLALTPAPPPSSRVLVSADRVSFPQPEDRGRWTDIAVSNLFQGNGLVGPIIKDLEPLRTIEPADDRSTAKELSRRLGDILDHLVRTQATVLVYDQSTKSLMKLAAHLAGKGPDYLNGLSYKENKRHSSAMSSKEELFEELAKCGHDESVFMVGTAYGRALASHRGYTTYFDCQDLSRFMDVLDKIGSSAESKEVIDPESPPKARGELFRLYRDVFSHTVWQINIPSSEWRRIEHYPLIMRMASLCYFTVDYIRSFADDFVRYLYDWHASKFASEDRVSRETIRQMLQDCFQFLTFDENPRLLFDPDSKFEFSPREPIREPKQREDPSVAPEPAPNDPPIQSEAPHAEDRVKLSSTVAAIHAELTSCRKRTVDVFGQMCEQLEQLERHHKDSRGHDSLRKAEMLRGYAWANFRIYNFYDSARLMEHAMRLVTEVVAETTREIWEVEACRDTRASEPAAILSETA